MSLSLVPCIPTNDRPARAVESLLLFIGGALDFESALPTLLRRAGAKSVFVVGIAPALDASAHVRFDGAVVHADLLHSLDSPGLTALRRELDCPLLVIADEADEIDEIVALEQGADDFLVRPVSGRRLSARLLALMRRPGAMPPTTRPDRSQDDHNIAGWRFDPALRLLKKGQQRVLLTELLATLLAELFRHRGKVVSREHLLSQVRWLGSNTKAQGISTYVHRLRRTLVKQGVQDFRIDCLSGRGYVLQELALPPIDLSLTLPAEANIG
jgi:DNA-binding response OmpR family regulator